MQRIVGYFKNRICLWLLPLLLTTAVGSVLIDCYAPSSKLLLTAAYALFALSVFILLDRFQKLRIFGGLLYTVMLILILAFSVRMVFSAEYQGQISISFQQWFYGIGVSDASMKSAAPYFAALFLGGGFFINSVLYYFTQVQYRALGTLLIIFIPFVIYAKRDDTISDVTVTLIITLFIAIIVHNRIFLNPDSGKGTVINTAYVMTVALFVSVTGALAMIFPDFSTPSRLEEDSSFLNFAAINGGGNTKLSNGNSSTHFHGVKYTNEPLFYVYPQEGKELDTPIFLRRRSMNAYDAQQLDWYVTRNIAQVNGAADTYDVSFPDLYEAERYKGENGQFNADPSAFKEDIPKKTATFEIEFEESVGMVPYIPAPLYSAVTPDDDVVSAVMRSSDYYELSPEKDAKDLGRITVDAVVCDKEAEEFAKKAGGVYVDFAKPAKRAMEAVLEYSESDTSLFDSEGEPKEGYEYEAFMSDHYTDYYELVKDNYHYNPAYLEENGLKDYDKIKALADEICKDCKSDYEKAKAIEKYFTDEGFVYDLDYIPDDESVSYFLFESKRGICIDFASAMGVMLIMESIPCRYVEGFVAFELDPEDSSRIVVRDSHAHAFIEAFIPYVGWMTFDPTVAGYMRTGSESEAAQDDSIFTLIIQYMGRILFVAGVLFVLVFIILLDRIWELFFRLTLRFYPSDKKLTRLYRHIFKLLEYEDKTDLAPYTSRLLNDYLCDKTGESLHAVTDLFDQHSFGAREVTEEQFTAAYDAYKALYPKIRKKKTA